jgi:hypothetical protein
MWKRIVLSFIPVIVFGTYFTWAAITPVNNGRINYIALSTDTKPFGTSGDILYESDTGRTWICKSDSTWTIALRNKTANPDTLTAPGNGSAVYCEGFEIGGFIFTVASINTSVTVELQGRITEQGWMILQISSSDSSVFSANGTYSVSSTNIALVDSLRLKFHSEAGGTAATIISNAVLRE